MLHKIKVLLIISLLILGGNIQAQPENLSITDFTMHKVLPKQDEPVKEPVFNPILNKEQTKHPVVKKTTLQKPASSSKPVQKPAPKPVAPVQKTPSTNQKDDINVIIQDIKEETADIEVLKNEELSGEQEINDEFDKQNILDNLNKRLEQDELADKSPQTGVKTNLNSYNHYDYIVKPTLSLGIVMALIFIFAWLYNKLKGVNPNNLFSGKLNGMDINQFKVLATSSLGQGKVIHLVEINGKQLVIGSTNNNINILTEINPEDLENLQAKAEKKTKPRKKLEPQESEELDGLEHTEPDSYSAKYTNLYKDYLDKE